MKHTWLRLQGPARRHSSTRKVRLTRASATQTFPFPVIRLVFALCDRDLLGFDDGCDGDGGATTAELEALLTALWPDEGGLTVAPPPPPWRPNSEGCSRLFGDRHYDGQILQLLQRRRDRVVAKGAGDGGGGGRTTTTATTTPWVECRQSVSARLKSYVKSMLRSRDRRGEQGQSRGRRLKEALARLGG